MIRRGFLKLLTGLLAAPLAARAEVHRPEGSELEKRALLNQAYPILRVPDKPILTAEWLSLDRPVNQGHTLTMYHADSADGPWTRGSTKRWLSPCITIHGGEEM